MLNEYKRRAGRRRRLLRVPGERQEAPVAGLKQRFEKADAQIPPEDVRDRILFIQAIETVRCVEEGVLLSTADANIGSIFGIGFAAWTAARCSSSTVRPEGLHRPRRTWPSNTANASRHRRCCWKRPPGRHFLNRVD
jgi:hypothetical protein